MSSSCQTHVWNISQKAQKFSRREHHFRVCDVKVTRGCSAPSPCACVWTAAKKAMQRPLWQIGPINPCNTAIGGPRGSDTEMNAEYGFHWRVLDKTVHDDYLGVFTSKFSTVQVCLFYVTVNKLSGVSKARCLLVKSGQFPGARFTCQNFLL